MSAWEISWDFPRYTLSGYFIYSRPECALNKRMSEEIVYPIETVLLAALATPG